MADKTSLATITEHNGPNGAKEVRITTDATFATGDTIDLGSDSAVDVTMQEIHQIYGGEDTGEVKVFTFDAATGIITAGTITTGIHKIVVWGK